MVRLYKMLVRWLKKFKNVIYNRAGNNTKSSSTGRTIIEINDDCENESVWNGYFNDKSNGGK